MHEHQLAEHGLPILLPESLEISRRQLESDFQAAGRRIRKFADHHGWTEAAKESFIDFALIFDDKTAFDRMLLSLTSGDLTSNLPKSFSAALEHRIFISVSPDLYQLNYPEGIEPDFYQKLIAHEIAHRLHIRILDGDEDAMGPVWFFEGFAIFAASQFETQRIVLDQQQILSILGRTDRINYAVYGALIQKMCHSISITELVRNAGRKDFSEWLNLKGLL